jgi:hypothetical protein
MCPSDESCSKRGDDPGVFSLLIRWALLSLGAEDFPVFSLLIRDLPPETISPQTPSTATQAAEQRLPARIPKIDPEKLANSRGVGG